MTPDMKFAESWIAVYKHCDSDIESTLLLIEQIKCGVPPMPPDEILEAVMFILGFDEVTPAS
jgi:hypothetical protein